MLRFPILCNSLLSPHSLLPKPTLPSPHDPLKSIKFTGLPLPPWRFRTLISTALPSSMEAPPPAGYRRNVGICLINSSKKIFSASRLDIPDSWQMPQGGIDESENPRDAAIRELREETGVTSAEVLAEVPQAVLPDTVFEAVVRIPYDMQVKQVLANGAATGYHRVRGCPEAPYWLTYDFPLEVREKLNREWGSDWKGQAQKWFLFKFTGNEEEINLLGDGTEKAEFGQWLWMSPEQVLDLAVDFKKPVYKEVVTVFSSYL